MKKQILSNALTIVLLLFAAVAQAQPGWNWCDPVDKTTELNALLSDNVKAANFEAAKKPLDQLLESCPRLHVSLYQNGIKVYKGLVDVTKDPALKSQYKDKVIELYDKRIEYFGKEASVLNRKALDAYKYYRDDKTKYVMLLQMFDRDVELNKNRIYSQALYPYMDVVQRYKIAGNQITDEEILNRYAIITDIADAKMANKISDSERDRIIQSVDAADKILLNIVKLECSLVSDIFGPKLRETRDLKMAKKVFSLMLKGKCSSDPLAIEAAEIIGKEEQNATIFKFLAQKAAGEKNYDEAISNFEKALNLEEDNLKKSEMYVDLARIYALRGSKVSARDNAKKALSNDPSNKEAYKLIGDLYLNSFEQCKKGVSRVEDRAVFIAAYNMYKRAGNSSAMAAAKAQFPSIDEIFNEGYKEGQTITVSCWIGETVSLERRPSN